MIGAAFLPGVILVGGRPQGQRDAPARGVGVEARLVGGAAHQRLRRFAGVDPGIVDEGLQRLDPLHLLAQERGDRREGQLKRHPGECRRDVLENVLELLRAHVRERTAEGVDAAAAGAYIGELDRRELIDLVGGAEHQAAPGVGVHRLPAEGAGCGDIADGAQVVEHLLRFGVQVGAGGKGDQTAQDEGGAGEQGIERTRHQRTPARSTGRAGVAAGVAGRGGDHLQPFQQLGLRQHAIPERGDDVGAWRGQKERRHLGHIERGGNAIVDARPRKFRQRAAVQRDREHREPELLLEALEQRGELLAVRAIAAKEEEQHVRARQLLRGADLRRLLLPVVDFERRRVDRAFQGEVELRRGPHHFLPRVGKGRGAADGLRLQREIGPHIGVGGVHVSDGERLFESGLEGFVRDDLRGLGGGCRSHRRLHGFRRARGWRIPIPEPAFCLAPPIRRR